MRDNRDLYTEITVPSGMTGPALELQLGYLHSIGITR